MNIDEKNGEPQPEGGNPVEEERVAKKARGIVRRAAVSAALAGASPIPLGGLAGVPALQAMMLVSLAKTFGRTLRLKEARDMAGLLGGATALQSLCRLFARTAARAIPAVGLVAGAAAAGGTAFGSAFALGQVAIRYFRLPARAGMNLPPGPPGPDLEGFEREARALQLEWEAGAIAEETYRRDLDSLRKGFNTAREDPAE